MKNRPFPCASRICALLAGLLVVANVHAIRAANHAPVVIRIPDMTIYVREPVRFAVQASDADRNPLTYSMNGLPASAVIGASTGRFSWDPAMADTGARTAVFAVSDGIASASIGVQIVVAMPKLGSGEATRVLRPNGGETYRYGDTLNVAFVTLSCSMQAQVIVQYGKYYRNKWLYTAQYDDRLLLDGSPIDERGVACRYFYSFPDLGVSLGFYRLALRDTSLVTVLGRLLSFGGDSVAIDSLKISINDPYGSEGPCAALGQGSGVLNGDLSDAFFTVAPHGASAVHAVFRGRAQSGYDGPSTAIVTQGRLFMPNDHPFRMQIFDMKGTLVREFHGARGAADLSGLCRGCYAGRIELDGVVGNMRIVLQ